MRPRACSLEAKTSWGDREPKKNLSEGKMQDKEAPNLLRHPRTKKA